MAITRMTTHDSHQVNIHLTKHKGPHYSALWCRSCGTHIQWLSKQQTHDLHHIGVKIITPWQDPKELGI
jgi:hypothetical protein